MHNVRRAYKVKQLYLARLGELPEDHRRRGSAGIPRLPFAWTLNWTADRDEQVNNQVDLFDSKSAYVRKLLANLRTLNLDLADLFPPLLDVSEAPATGHELVTQLRLLHSTVGV